MGRGIAYQFKLHYPENNKEYVRACRDGELYIGSIHSYREKDCEKLIVNFPTKNKWREKSQISYIRTGLDLLVSLVKKENIQSIAMPALGCGNGGLDWNEVKPVIEEKMSAIPNCNIVVFLPATPDGVAAAPKLSISSLVLLQIKMHLDNWGFLRMQYTGFFLNYYLKKEYFKFDNWKSGPYSNSLDVAAKKIKKYQEYLNVQNPEDTYKLAHQVITSRKTEVKLQKLLPAIEKAANYVNSIENDHDLEGITTVLYLIQNNVNDVEMNEEKVLELLKDRSKSETSKFTEQQISGYLNHLVDTRILYKNLFESYELND